jgi:protein-L-isoaspartate(D-aspartate) O-methyltransferase
MSNDFGITSKRMVDEQLRIRNITSEAVLAAMQNVPRHRFVPENLQSRAYSDSPLPIGSEQTISQPYIVAYMTEQLALAPGMKVLEIGTGSGYQAAILAALGCEVYTVERIEELAVRAKQSLSDVANVHCRHGDGFLGWPEKAPFDAIIVTAAPESIPEGLVDQLNDGGRMIVPVGEVYDTQWLKLIVKKDGTLTITNLLPVRFVPMLQGERV